MLAVKIHDRLSYTLMAGVEYMILSVCLIGQTFAAFASPIGINRLLKSVFYNLWKRLLILIASVTWKPAVRIPLSVHGSGSSGSLLGQSSEIYASSGTTSL